MTSKRWGTQTRQDEPEGGRDKILSAAKRCYAEKGIASTTIDDIATEAKISRRTVFRYFEKKHLITQAIVDDQAEVFFVQMQKELSKTGDDFKTLLKNTILYSIKLGPEAPGHQLLLGAKNASDTEQYYFSSKQIYKCWKSILKEPFNLAQRNGEISNDITYDELIPFIGRIIFSYIQMPTDQKTLEKILDKFVLKNLN